MLLQLATCVLLAVPQDPPPPQQEFLPAKERDAFLAEVEQKMGGVESVLAEFTQEKHLELFTEVAKSRGVILFARPGRLRWEVQSPFRSALLVDGDKVAKFEGVGTGWKKLELGRGGDIVLMVMRQIREWFRGRFQDASGMYDIQVAVAPTPRIVLRPKDRDMQKGIECIELRLGAELAAVVGVTIREVGGDWTQMDFVELPRPQSIADACFSLTDPAPIDVAKLRATKGEHGLGDGGPQPAPPQPQKRAQPEQGGK